MSSLTTSLQQNRPSLVLALLAFLLHVTANALDFYDYFRDEFYCIACSDHLGRFRGFPFQPMRYAI